MSNVSSYNILCISEGYFILAQHTSLAYVKYVFDLMHDTHKYLDCELEIVEIKKYNRMGGVFTLLG